MRTKDQCVKVGDVFLTHEPMVCNSATKEHLETCKTTCRRCSKKIVWDKKTEKWLLTD